MTLERQTSFDVKETYEAKECGYFLQVSPQWFADFFLKETITPGSPVLT